MHLLLTMAFANILDFENVIKIFERFRLYDIKTKYIGRELSHDGTCMQDDKIRKVLDYPLPEYVKQLNSFIGLAEYFRSHVYEDLSEVMIPLEKLVSKFQMAKSKIKWEDGYLYQLVDGKE